jgi:hypothetical protein
VTTFEILGWDVGGIDRGYPQYTPDPKLGTKAEFRQALAAVRKLGVHPLIFANIQVADTATKLYKEQLYRYAVRGRWADDLRIMGWGEGTVGARMGLSRSNMTAVSPAFPEFRKLLTDQFAELVRDGAEGLQLDKTVMVGMLDFNPRLPVSPDRSLPAGLLTALRETVERGREIDPRFAVASEILWDRAYQWVDVSYNRMGQIDAVPVLKYTFPETTATIFGENPFDYNAMNNGMRYGMVWALAPRHYNDSLDEPLTQPLSRYVAELIRIRAKHKDVLFHGRFRDTEGAEVKGGPPLRHSVFESWDGKRKACVVVNFGNTPEEATVNWSGGMAGRVTICRPFEPDTAGTMPARVRLAPRSCAVVVAEP